MEDIRLRECLTQWLEIKGLPALHFVIEPETLERLEFRRIFIAERGDDVVAFLILSPIPARNGWLTEQFPHKPNAPNGTVELMLSEAAGKLADDGAQYLTLGLSPLSVRANTEVFHNPLWLQALLFWMRKHGQRFYNFDGLDFFKAKFLPQYWEPVYAITNERVFTGRALWAIAKAFTANQPVRVISKGLFKAVVAEMRNFRNFLRSHIMKK
jgi:phosphatidylglycerol lysyltransferase